MTRILILLLGLHCLLNSSNQVTAIDADCDDPNTFEAVNEVLRSYNDAKEDGNQFILYRTTDVSLKQENESLTHYFVTFDIKESVCDVKSGILWQGCYFNVREDAGHGDCTGHVLVNSQLKTKEVLSRSCTVVKGGQASQEPVLEPTVVIAHQHGVGFFHPIDTNSQDLSPVLQAATEQMNRQRNYPFHFSIEDVVEASRQVIHGWIYKVKYTIRQTNCSKHIYPHFNLEECKPVMNGQGGNCSVNVFVTPKGQINDLVVNCYLSTGFCFTCPTELEPNDPELQGLLNHFIKQYNSENNYTNLYKVDNVIKATRMLTADQKEYGLSFTIQVTNCSISDHLILGDDCDFQPTGNRFTCEVKMNVANETVNILPDYSCLHSASKALRITLKGFSPLRSVTLNLDRKRRSSKKSKGEGHGPNHKEDKKRKEEMKKDQGKKKHDNKKQKDHSSEESKEEDKRKPVVPPRHPQHEIPKVHHKDVNVLVPISKEPLSTDEIPRQPVTQPPTPFIPNLSSSSLPVIPVVPVLPELEEAFPNIHDSDLYDLPVPTSANIPKCPGKLWQPLKPVLQIPTDKPFVIAGDFEITHDDLAPPEVQDELPSENQPNEFNDFDLTDALDF